MTGAAEGRETSGSGFAIALLALVVLGGGLRLFVMEQTFPVRLVGDESYYARAAFHIAAGEGHRDRYAGSGPESRAWRPPAHAFLLSRFADAEADARDAAARRPLLHLQVVLGTALVVLTVFLGQALFDRRTGLLAGLVTALYPTLVVYSHYLWSETFFAVVITGALLCAVQAQRKPSLGLAVAAGALFGVATLTRELALGVAGLAAAWWLFTARAERRRSAAVRGTLMLAVVILTVLPWTARNHALFDRLVPVSTVGWFAAAEGNTFESDWRAEAGPAAGAFRRRYFAIADEMDRMDFARHHTLERIRAEQPAWILKKAARNLPQLLDPGSFLFYKIRVGAYGAVGEARRRGLAALTGATYVLVVLGGMAGIAVARGNGRRLLPCGIFALVLAVHVLANASTRFRVPWMPILAVYASHFALHARAHASSLTPAGRLALASCAAGFLVLCAL